MIAPISAFLGGLAAEVPVEPDAPEAHDWLLEELAKPIYQAAKPSWFDLLSKAFFDWLNSLQFGAVQGPPALFLLILIIVLAAALVIAFLVFGMPRLNRRSAVTGDLFGEDDSRTAADIRKDAQDAAARGDYSTAVIEMFRCIARGLAERTVLTTSPGTTASGFAASAAESFPEAGTALAQAAVAFDSVRYLGREGSREQFEAISALEKSLREKRPLLETVTA